MAITEFWDSQEMHVTAEGSTATRVFTCTWADALAGTDGIFVLPVIGNFWSPERQDLRCTDLDLKALGRVNVRVTAFFSTEKSSVRRKRREDHVASWEENFELYLEETPVTTYYDTVAEEYKSWEKQWTGDVDKRPELFHLLPKANWNISCYSSSNRYAQILTHINKTNSNAFLKTYFLTWANSDIKTDDDPELSSWTDIDRWMFVGARANRIRTTCWRYDYSFLYDPNGWNTQHGVNTFQYETFDTTVLFDGMRATDEEGEGAFGAQNNTTQGGF